MPILLGLCGAVSAFSAKSAAERSLFYSIMEASLAEIVTIKVMLWLGQPLLMLLVFFLNAFMTIQLLRYWQRTVSLKRLDTDRSSFHMAKKPATVLGMTFRIALMAVLILFGAYLWLGPIVPFRVYAIITAAVLAPGVTLAIIQQIRLRRALSHEKTS